MSSFSILFDKENRPEAPPEPPDFFVDLNLNQVIDAITAPKADYNLKPFFYMPVRDVDTIYYRHEVMRDVEKAAVRVCIDAFAEKMKTVWRYLGMAQKLTFHHNKQGWFLEAALLYCDAVNNLQQGLAQAPLQSRGLQALRAYLADYIRSAAFQSLQTEAQSVKSGLFGLKYNILIQEGRFSVQKYEDEADYSIEVTQTFEKFRQGAVRSYLSDLYKGAGMSHIEAKVLEFVALLYPQPFAALDQFCATHQNFADDTLRAFDREIQFYVAVLDFIADIKRRGLSFCYPQVGLNRAVYVRDGFDLALAHVLKDKDQPVICNDFHLVEPERVMVVSGPNQGGKTTFARMFGQLHYLACLGCPTPGREARLFVFDQIYTHFERQEDIRNLRGKLEDDVARIHAILTHATPHSIIILNEIFSSTTLQDAVFLSKEIMTRILALDALCVWVTFIDELSTLSAKTVSMVSIIAPEQPAVRTFKIVRKPAEGLAYALSLAEKHGLTYQQIMERMRT